MSTITQSMVPKGGCASFSCLPGSMEQPDTVSILIYEPNPDVKIADADIILVKGEPVRQEIKRTNHWLNTWGYFPLISIISGTYRMLLGVVNVIVHFIYAIFDPKHNSYHLDQMKLGIIHFLRGSVEILPVVGNGIIFVIDMIRVNKFEKQIYKKLEDSRASYHNTATLFVYGKQIDQMPLNEFEKKNEILNKTKKPTSIDYLNIFQNKV